MSVKVHSGFEGFLFARSHSEGFVREWGVGGWTTMSSPFFPSFGPFLVYSLTPAVELLYSRAVLLETSLIGRDFRAKLPALRAPFSRSRASEKFWVEIDVDWLVVVTSSYFSKDSLLELVAGENLATTDG